MSRPPKIDFVAPLLDYLPAPSASPIMLYEQALDRILAALGATFVPADFNRNALLTAIEQAMAAQKIIDRSRKGPRARGIAKIMNRIRVEAKALTALLQENDDVLDLIRKEVPSVLEDVDRLRVVAEVLKQTHSKPSEAALALYGRIPSSSEWLAGVELPLIYEDCFHRKAGRSRTGGKPGGPTVRFVAAVMLEVGLPLAADTIIRAMTRFADLRERRRAVRQGGHGIGQK
jgi:hypothetical protein